MTDVVIYTTPFKSPRRQRREQYAVSSVVPVESEVMPISEGVAVTLTSDVPAMVIVSSVPLVEEKGGDEVVVSSPVPAQLPPKVAEEENSVSSYHRANAWEWVVFLLIIVGLAVALYGFDFFTFLGF